MANGRSGGRNRSDDTQALMVVQPDRLPMPPEAAAAGINPTQWTALVDAVFPSAKSVGGVMLAINYCKARNLDVFKRPVHVVPMYNSKLGREVETVWPGIGEMRTTASRTGTWAGNDECAFGRILRQHFMETQSGQGTNGPWSKTASCPEMEFPEWAQLTVYRIVAGVRVPFVGPKVMFMETFSGEKGMRVPNTRWRQAPRQMLEKCAEAAALRRAFPEELAGEYSAEEMEGQTLKTADLPQAKYQVVDDNADAGDDQDKTSGQAGTTDDTAKPARDLNGWNEQRLAHYMATMRDAFEGFKNLHFLDRAVESERKSISTLPEPEATEARDLEAAARARLDIGGDDQQDRDESDGAQPVAADRVNDAGDDASDAGDAGDAGDAAPDEPAFVRNLRKRIDEITDLDGLSQLERAEKRAIETQTIDVVRACDRVIADKRNQLRDGAA